MKPLSLGSRLAALRRVRGLTQQQLATAAGLTQVHIARLETGSRGQAIPYDTLRRLARALAARVEELLP